MSVDINRTIFLIAILLCNGTYPVIENITQAKDPQGEKTFVFLHDIHFQELVNPVKEFLGDEGVKKLSIVAQEQNKIFQNKILNVLKDNDRLSKGTMLITETGLIPFNSLKEKTIHSDTVGANFYEQQELLWSVPYLLFSHATKSGIDPDTKRSLLQNYLINGVYGDNSSVLHAQPTPTVSWIIGDRWRSLTDLYISRLIPGDWQKMKPFLETNEQLKPINIQYVKNHITDLQKFLNQKNIPDDCCEKALNIIKELLAEEKIVATDHFVKIYEYLAENGLISIQQELNFSINKAVSKVFDAELLHYLEHLNEIGKDAASVVLFIGNTHAQNVLDILEKKGYRIENPLTTNDSQSMQEGLATIIANTAIVNKALQSSSWF